MSESCTQASGFIHTPPVPRLIQLGADTIAIGKLVLLPTLSPVACPGPRSSSVTRGITFSTTTRHDANKRVV